MEIMFLVILFSVLYANAEGKGIVKNVMENGSDWPEEGKTQYTHHLECDYRHKFPLYPSWTFAYDIHCIATKGESGKTKLTLSINYDNNVFDNFEVTTCKLESVIKSVFPPAQKTEYPPEDEPDSDGRPTVFYIKYKNDEGKCFARKYKYTNRMSKAAERFEKEEIDCESELTKYGNVAEFTNCRVPKLPLSEIVIDVSNGGKPAWPLNEEEGKKYKRILECTFDQFSQLYGLTCIQDDKADKYFAFVTYEKDLLDRFTVVSCKEDDIVNGIFPVKGTSANPKWIEKIFFRMTDGECYRREYRYSGPLMEKEPCPDVADKWTNPTWGKAGIWRECKVPESVQGTPVTRSQGESGKTAGGQREANAEGNGIVNNVMGNGSDWPEEGKTHYTHHLVCDYRHNFPKYPSWTFTYDIHCIETKGESGETKLTLSINYDEKRFDSFEVTTCEPQAVIKSVFPPAQKTEYPPEDEPNAFGMPTASYLKYKTDEGKCFARKYKYKNTSYRAAERFQPEEIDCEGELTKYGNVAEFTNCRVPKLPLSKIVIDYSHGKPAWTLDDKEGKEHKRLLECTFDQFSKFYNLTCVKGFYTDEYFAFVTYRKEFLDRFTVVSCKEEDIVNGIFPMKEMKENPKYSFKFGLKWHEKIFFRMTDGECYRREYKNIQNGPGPLTEKEPEPCPDVADKWTNPTWGKAGIWRECKVPESVQEEESEESEESEDCYFC